MMKRRILVLMFFLNFTLVNVAQKPFGHRFSIGFNQGYSMINVFSLEFVGHSRLEMTCSLGKSFMVGLEANYSFAKLSGYTDQYVVENVSFDTPVWTQEPQIRDISGGLKLYYFRNRKAVGAPTGQYVVASVNYGIKNKHVRTELEVLPPNSSEKKKYISITETSEVIERSCIISFGFGRNFLLKRRILFGYGLDFGVELYPGKYDVFQFRHFMKPIVKIGYTF